MGCGNAYEGGRCIEKNMINCVFDSTLPPNVHLCANSLHLVKVSQLYECKEQRGKYKCIKVWNLFYFFEF